MSSKTELSVIVFGPGHGESIVMVTEPESPAPVSMVIDCFSTQPYDSPEKNPVIGIQPGLFDWKNLKAICLTHGHEDHFMGLAEVARKSSDPKWVWPGKIDISDIVKYYKRRAELKSNPARPDGEKQSLFSEAIESLADWSETANRPWQALIGREFEMGRIILKFIAPHDKTSQDYSSVLLGSFAESPRGSKLRPPQDFHNLPSAGIIAETESGARIALLGDMVKESWEHILADDDIDRELERKPVDVLKLPHQCTTGAVWEGLLEKICDKETTKAVLAPFRLRRPPPHPGALSMVKEHVKELWCTTQLEEQGIPWIPSGLSINDKNLALGSLGESRAGQSRKPLDCMVRFDIGSDGMVEVKSGAGAQLLYRR